MTRSIAALSRLVLIITLTLLWGAEAQAQKKVRFAYPSSADIGDVPSLLAWEQLKKQGIEVVPTFFPKTDLAVQAVVAGEAARVVAGPEDQVVGLRDHDHLLAVFHGLSRLLC